VIQDHVEYGHVECARESAHIHTQPTFTSSLPPTHVRTHPSSPLSICTYARMHAQRKEGEEEGSKKKGRRKGKGRKREIGMHIQCMYKMYEQMRKQKTIIFPVHFSDISFSCQGYLIFLVFQLFSFSCFLSFQRFLFCSICHILDARDSSFNHFFVYLALSARFFLASYDLTSMRCVQV